MNADAFGDIPNLAPGVPTSGGRHLARHTIVNTDFPPWRLVKIADI